MSGYSKVLMAVFAVTTLVGSSIGSVAAARPAVSSSADADNAPSAARCAQPGQVVDRGAGWTSIAVPLFPPRDAYEALWQEAGQQGTSSVTGFAVDPLDPTRIFVTDGYTIMRWLDSNCSWEVVFSAGDVLPVDSPNKWWPANIPPRISQITIPDRDRSAEAKVYAVVSYEPLGSDRGRTWLVAGGVSGDPDSWAVQSEIPLTSRSQILEFVPHDPNVAFLVSLQRLPGVDNLVIRKTTDGGVTWTIQSEIQSIGQPVKPDPTRVIATDPQTVFLFIGGGRGNRGHWIFSTDGGSTWTNGDYLWELESTQPTTGPPELIGLVEADAGMQTEYIARGDVQTRAWKQWAVRPDSEASSGGYGSFTAGRIAVGSTPDSMLWFGNDHKVWRFDPRLRNKTRRAPWLDVTPPGLPEKRLGPGYPPTIFLDAAVSFDGTSAVFSVLVSSQTGNVPEDQAIWQHTAPRGRR